MTPVKGSRFTGIMGYFYLSFLDSDTIQCGMNTPLWSFHTNRDWYQGRDLNVANGLSALWTTSYNCKQVILIGLCVILSIGLGLGLC